MSDEHKSALVEGLQKELDKVKNFEDHAGSAAQHLLERAERLVPLLENGMPWHSYSKEQLDDAVEVAKKLNIGPVDYTEDK